MKIAFFVDYITKITRIVLGNNKHSHPRNLVCTEQLKHSLCIIMILCLKGNANCSTLQHSLSSSCIF